MNLPSAVLLLAVAVFLGNAMSAIYRIQDHRRIKRLEESLASTQKALDLLARAAQIDISELRPRRFPDPSHIPPIPERTRRNICAPCLDGNHGQCEKDKYDLGKGIYAQCACPERLNHSLSHCDCRKALNSGANLPPLDHRR